MASSPHKNFMRPMEYEYSLWGQLDKVSKSLTRLRADWTKPCGVCTSSGLSRPLCDVGELFNDLLCNLRMACYHVEKPAQSDSGGVAASDEEIEDHVTQVLVRARRFLTIRRAQIYEAR